MFLMKGVMHLTHPPTLAFVQEMQSWVRDRPDDRRVGLRVDRAVRESGGAEVAEFSVTGERDHLSILSNPWLPGAGDNAFGVQVYGQPGRTVQAEDEAEGDARLSQVRLVQEGTLAGRTEARWPAPSRQDPRRRMQRLIRREAEVRAQSL